MNPLQRQLYGGTVHHGDAWTCSKLGEHVPSQPRNSTDGVAAQAGDSVEVLPMGISNCSVVERKLGLNSARNWSRLPDGECLASISHH